MIQIKDLNKTYGEGTNAVHALRNCNVEFEYGKFTAIIGTSGSGKSTFFASDGRTGYKGRRRDIL